jgi:colanic acid/amylovoran biosynthesis glycosyltransferase
LSDQPPVVAHLVHHYAAPTETFIVNQIESLSRYRACIGCHHRHRESPFVLADGTVAADLLKGLAGSLDRLAYARLTLPTPLAAAAIARGLAAHKPRLAHVHYLSDACYFHGTLRRLRVPFVISGYGYDITWFPRRSRGLAGLLARRALKDATAVLAMSEDMRRDLIALGCPTGKIITHYHGIDTQRFVRRQPRAERADGDVRLLSCCGRLAEKKGLEVTLQALARLRDRGITGWHLTVMGDGPRRAEIAALIRRLDLAQRVRLRGHVSHFSAALPACYHEADVLIQPSLLTADGDKEGIPGAIIEGMASELAVVATRHAGIPAVLEDGVSGLLVPERDPVALAAAIERLVVDSGLRHRLGAAAARHAIDELDLSVRTPILESIYDRVASEAPR